MSDVFDRFNKELLRLTMSGVRKEVIISNLIDKISNMMGVSSVAIVEEPETGALSEVIIGRPDVVRALATVAALNNKVVMMEKTNGGDS
jgi:hypothetical protein